MAYGYVLGQLKTKLENKIKMYVFIGYDEQAKAYKLYNPISSKKFGKLGYLGK